MGTFPKSKSPDASQELVLHVGLSKDSNLGSATLIPSHTVSHEVAVKLLAGSPTLEALTGALTMLKRKFTYMAIGWKFFTRWFSPQGYLNVLNIQCIPQWAIQEHPPNGSYHLKTYLKVTYHSFCYGSQRPTLAQYGFGRKLMMLNAKSYGLIGAILEAGYHSYLQDQWFPSILHAINTNFSQST